MTSTLKTPVTTFDSNGGKPKSTLVWFIHSLLGVRSKYRFMWTQMIWFQMQDVWSGKEGWWRTTSLCATSTQGTLVVTTLDKDVRRKHITHGYDKSHSYCYTKPAWYLTSMWGLFHWWSPMYQSKISPRLRLGFHSFFGSIEWSMTCSPLYPDRGIPWRQRCQMDAALAQIPRLTGGTVGISQSGANCQLTTVSSFNLRMILTS